MQIEKKIKISYSCIAVVLKYKDAFLTQWPKVILQVWLVIIMSCIFMGPLLYMFVNYLHPMVRPKKDCDKLNLQMSYWFVYGAMLKQGSTREPRTGNLLAYFEVSLFEFMNYEQGCRERKMNNSHDRLQEEKSFRNANSF